MGLRLSEVFTKRRQMEIMISCSRNVAQNGGGKGWNKGKEEPVPGKLGSSSFPVILSRNKIFTASSLISTFRNFQSVFIGNI